MKRYALVISIVAAGVVVPAAIAHLSNADIAVLAPWAAIQMFVCLFLIMTIPVSLVSVVIQLVRRCWINMVWAVFASAMPVMAWSLSAYTNPHGWEAVMGI